MSQAPQFNQQILQLQTQVQTQATALKQLNSDNEALKKQLQDLRFENQKLNELTKQTQEWKDKYERLHKQHHSVEHTLKKKDEEIENLQNTIKDLKEKTKDLDDYHRLKNIAQDLQLKNADLTNELEDFKKKQYFIVKTSTKIMQEQNLLSVKLQWDKDIQNLQLTYKIENDKILFEGYGELRDKKIIYSQYHELPKKVLNNSENEKPAIDLKQSQMTITFKV